MDAVALQNFMRLRETAAARIQTPTPASSGKAEWQRVLEAKRQELGVTPTAPVAAKYTASRAQAIHPQDYQARAEQLQQKMAMGLPVRRTGNLLDVRA